MGKKNQLIDLSVFGGAKELHRKGDQLTGTDLGFMDVMPRIVREHLIPMWPYLLLSYGAGLLVSATTGAIPFLIQITSDKIVVEKDMASLSVIPFAVVAVMALKSLSEYVSAVAQAHISGRMSIRLKSDVITKLLNADLAWLKSVETGRLVASVTGDAQRIAMSSGLILVTLAKGILTALVLLGTMFYMDPILTTTTLVGLPLVLVFFRKQRKSIRRRTKREMEESGDVVSLIVQGLQGVRDVKAAGAEAAEISRVRTSLERAFVFSMQAVRTQAASGPITQVLAAIGIALAIWYGGYRGITGTMTPGEFMGFVTAAMLLYQPAKQIGQLQTILTGGLAAASRVFPIIDSIPSISDRVGAEPIADPQGRIRFDLVDFAYDASTPALRNVSFDIAPGQHVAFVGPSGAGKSTVMNLIMRFYEPTSGRVLIDEQDVTGATLASVRGACALVSQDPFMFDDTIAANIAYGNTEATTDDIENAAKMAAVHDFITQLPDGYDTQVGEGGGRLSGGQKQRLAIARAVLSDAPILLLDEPTSALDSDTEAAIEQVLRERLKDRTIVMIAHRLSTVRRADRIFVLDKGQLVEQGSHNELLQTDGIYARLHGYQEGVAS